MSLLITLIWVFVVILLLVVGFAVGYKMYKSGHNYKIRIRRLTSDNTKVVLDAIAKSKMDRERIPYLNVWFGFKKPLPNKLPLPPANAVNYDSQSNRLITEVWYDSERGYTYVTDDMNPQMLEKNEEVNRFGIYPTNYREMMVNQMYKRDSRKVTNWAQWFTNATPYIALIIILTVFLIFFGKAVQPINDMAKSVGDEYQGITESQADITEQLNLMFRNIVHYQNGEALEGGTQVIPPEE